MTIISTAPAKPANYGAWWNSNQHDESWYAEIYSHRPNAHSFFMNWVSNLYRQGDDVARVLEVGCGRGNPYAMFFRNVDYHGYDISEKEIAYCRAAYPFPPENFRALDVIATPVEAQFDLVFSHAVIDHVYDINLFLQKLANYSRKHLYISAYYDWRPTLAQHAYEWSEEYSCYHNTLSPAEIRLVLAAADFPSVEVFPVFNGRTDLTRLAETTIIARR